MADVDNNKIRKISPDGVVSTFAGTGIRGSTNGPVTTACFYRPYGVAVDQHGNVYVADYQNNLIRKITPDGVVTTLAGSGAPGAKDGTGTDASFSGPAGVAADPAGRPRTGAGDPVRRCLPFR